MQGESDLAREFQAKSITHPPGSIQLSKTIRGLILACIIGLIIGYSIQVRTPLRMCTDSYRYLSMAVSAANGKGYLVNGARDQFPKGYPWLVKNLLEHGIADSATLVLINLIAFLIALGLLSIILFQAGIGLDIAKLAIILSLSSWVVITHVTLPLSDLLYTCISFASLACLCIFWRKSKKSKWLWFLGSVCFALAATEVRSVGLVFAPTLICAAFFHSDSKPFRDFLRTHIFIFSMLICFILIVIPIAIFIISNTHWFFLQFIRKGSYFQNLIMAVKTHGILAFIFTNVSYRIFELGQILINIPMNMPVNKVPISTMICTGCGALGWIALLYGFWILRNKLAPVITYACFYIALMICWPYYDCRFWLPLIPVFSVAILAVAFHLSHANKIIDKACKAYLIYFVVLGIISLTSSSRISLSGKNFSEVYGDGTQKMTYRYVLHNNKPIDMKDVNLREAHLLKIFGMTK